ncbi:MAG: hypothetical protein JO316_17485 [Abitibacteriaceae bacterium]|nr:hypothetical protein [Abditibacteriaceae bacterium]
MSPKDLIGHEKRWVALARAFAKGKVPQTLLISGPPQIGKWTLALRYAQLLLCPNPQQGTGGETLPAPCGHCRVCHQVEIETFPDFAVYRPIVSSAKDEKDWVIAPDTLEGSIITVDVARKFGDEALRKPLVGPRKVMVINQADRMNTEAQNALLKTFEEPVHNLCIILLTDNPSQLLPTVYSRCWHVPLGLAPEAQIEHWLEQMQTDAGHPFGKTQIQEAVRVAAGRPGAAWRELQRLQRAISPTTPANGKVTGKKAAPPKEQPNTPAISRFAQATEIVDRIISSQPVGALGLSEEAGRLARLWWDEDQEGAKDLKKGDAKVQRSAVARFLDELSNAYRVRWVASVAGTAMPSNGTTHRNSGNLDNETLWADGLDQIRKTRHYILRNANTTLALDVMFGQLIASHRARTKTTANGNGRSAAMR